MSDQSPLPCSADCQARSQRLPRHAEHARHALPHARRPAQARAGLGQGLERGGSVHAPARRAQGRAAVRAARRPTVCQRQAAHRPRAEQGAQGHDRQEPPAGRLRRAVHPRLGLPWAADRERDRKAARPQPEPRRHAGEKPRLCHGADRPAARRLQAPGRARRLGAPLPHHGPCQRRRSDPRVQARDRARLRLPRPQARVLVLRLRLQPGRVRDRIRRQEKRHAGRGLRVRRSDGTGQGLRTEPVARRKEGLRRHLDHHRLDHPGEPGAQRAPGAGVRPGGHPARRAAARCQPGRKMPGALPARRPCDRHRQGRGPAWPGVPPPLVRCGRRHDRLRLSPPGAPVPGRLRQRQRRHRHRAFLAGLRRGRLQLLRGARHALRGHPEPGAGQRQLRRRPSAVRRPEHLEGLPRHHRHPCASTAA
jgi:hypothetical protein